jgi:hypothetical protein
VSAGGGRPLFDLDLFKLPGVTLGVLTVWLVMGGYAGFLLMLTLHLQENLRFTPLHAGMIFATYAGGFAGASLTWSHAPRSVRGWLPPGGAIVMGAALLAVGVLARGVGWPSLAPDGSARLSPAPPASSRPCWCSPRSPPASNARIPRVSAAAWPSRRCDVFRVGIRPAAEA